MARTGNRLLDKLSDPVLKDVLAASRPVDLPLRHDLFVMGHVPTHVHFLLSGAASMVVHMAEGGSAEVGMVGREGLAGAAALLGPAPSPVECVMQVGGAGLRLQLATMDALFQEHRELRRLVLQFQQSQFNIASQISACNKLHEAEARLARWLLTAADRSGFETLLLTQEYLSQMLGTQRTTVSLVAGQLQEKGLIEYSRGAVVITNRYGLIDTACDCYGVTKGIIDLLYE